MGIRNIVNSERDRYDPSHEPPLTLTEAAAEEVRTRLAGYEGGEGLAFFILTQPTQIGFSVGVGFEPKTSDRPLRPEFPVPFQVTDEDYERLRGYTIDVRAGKFVTFTNVSVQVAETPNPESRKFSLNRNLMTEGSATHARPVRDTDPTLVRFLLEIPEVKGLFFIQRFCTVTRMPGADWPDLQAEIGKRLQAYFAHGGTAMEPSPRDPAELGDVERRIVEILEDVVRPAVQRDGGDIAFAGYDDGVVQLYMLGSCTGCPSSRATLKMGVETLLKDAIPEIREVVAIE